MIISLVLYSKLISDVFNYNFIHDQFVEYFYIE